MTADRWANMLAALGVRSSTADDWADVFARVIDERTFSHARDLPNFLGQVLHESGMLGRLEENLNYSAERLMQVWPGRFPTYDAARSYARNPRALANKVYGGRMGNDTVNDGWTFRGRGLIQITGRANYVRVQQMTGMPVLQAPDLLTQPEPALRASIAWWEANVPDAALGDVARVTRVVNGGTVGFAHRAELTARASRELGVPA